MLKRRLIYYSVSFLVCSLVLVNICVHAETTEEEAKQHYRVGKILYEHGFYNAADTEFKNSYALLKDNKKSADILEQQDGEEEMPVSVSKEPGRYIIRQGDRLSISVWESPDLDRTVIVRPDGMVSFPLIDEVRAGDLTIAQLDKAITERLKEYLRAPDVSISLEGTRGSKVIVLGQVNEPGVYAIQGRKTILEAIALAQDFTRDSVASSVIHIRGPRDNPQAQRINLTKALQEPGSKENIELQDEDIIFVPRKFITNLSWFVNEVLTPFRDAYNFKEDVKTWEWKE